ncbi:outer membrane beta-barrel protein [Flavobacterium sp. J372]|uniref:outer membrane beta-barrel protein n=1 Tax=Flavobacterium sp. J372 TaxID=2898436 RepID=UPI0021519D17|nr:outer membrane beta-barrel protein [Flavobacterium sp. J372]MCR5863169.1 outer membrane beta-barrel protein [Flavobacterium sp. J372]
MKKIILSAAAIVAIAFSAKAQETETPAFGFSAGNIIVEGNLSWNSTKEEEPGVETKENFFSFNPKAGYFITDKFAVGVELGIGSNKEEVTPDGAPTSEEKTNFFGAGVFGRYYFLELGQRFKTYAEVGVGFGGGKTEVDGTEISKNNGVNAGLDLGINYFITPSFAINFGLADVISYNSFTLEDPATGDETKTNTFEGNINVFNNFFSTATFGLTYKF